MYNKSEDKDENQDKEIERAEKYYGDLPPDTESKDLVSNDVDDLEEAVDKNKIYEDHAGDLSKRIAEFFGGGSSGGSHRGTVKDPAHDHRLKQNKDDAGGNGGDGDHQDHDEHDEAVNENYDRAEQRKIEEHKRLLEQQENNRELSNRQHQVNIQNAFSPTASLLNNVRNHHIYGSEMSRRITKNPTVASLNSARQWLKKELANTQSESEKKELYTLVSKVASLLIEAGTLNINING